MDTLHDGRRLPTDEEPKCPRCDGTGIIPDRFDYTLEMYEWINCPDCNGTGYQQLEEEEDGRETEAFKIRIN